MGADIHTWATDDAGEIINDRGKWCEWIDGKRNGEPFSDRHYRLFGWLGDVRNYSGVKPIADYRGWDDAPESVKREGEFSCDHSHSWVGVQELADINYDQIIEDRRCTRTLASGLVSGGETCGPGEGNKMTLREFLGSDYFHDLEELQRIGAVRVWFGFDS